MYYRTARYGAKRSEMTYTVSNGTLNSTIPYRKALKWLRVTSTSPASKAIQTRNKSIVPSRTMHTGRMSCHSTKKDVNYYVSSYHAQVYFSQTLQIRLFTLCKISTAIFESCGTIYRGICEMFSALQSASGPVTDVENSVQIDA